MLLIEELLYILLAFGFALYTGGYPFWAYAL